MNRFSIFIERVIFALEALIDPELQDSNKTEDNQKCEEKGGWK